MARPKDWPVALSAPEEKSVPADPRLRAAGLALGMLAHCKVSTWADLETRVEQRDPVTVARLRSVKLADDQRQAMADHPAMVRAVAATVRASATQAEAQSRRTIATCTNCEGWIMLSGATKDKLRCPVCEAPMTKAAPAAMREIPTLAVVE